MLPFFTYSTPAAGQGTADAYADVKFILDNGGLDAIIRAITSGPLSFQLQNSHATNSITYQVLGTNDLSWPDAKWVTVVAGTALAGATVAAEYVDSARFLFYKVQIKATAGGSQGTLIAAVASKRF